jgi:hypothetical protein
MFFLTFLLYLLKFISDIVGITSVLAEGMCSAMYEKLAEYLFKKKSCKVLILEEITD